MKNGGCDVNAVCSVDPTSPSARVCTCGAGYTGDGVSCLGELAPRAFKPANANNTQVAAVEGNSGHILGRLARNWLWESADRYNKVVTRSSRYKVVDCDVKLTFLSRI